MEGRKIMLNRKIETALNDQLNYELYSSYLYMSMASYFHSVNLKGFANWMTIQAQEELFHALKFYNFIIERGAKVILHQIHAPKTEWNSPKEAFESRTKHEQFVTERINKLVDLAIENKDHATNIFLQWFVTEQIEEEASASDVINKLKLMGDSAGGLFMLDSELAQRVYVPPADNKNN